jgi:histone acetyltransferase (RNA polymerase elongator complex component)
MKQYIIPIFVPHLGCPNDCIFCNQKSISGQKKQITKEEVKKTIEEHLKNIKNPGKVEIAFFGGSFTGIDIELQKEVKEIGIEDMSLQKIYANLFGQKIAKNQQLSNWEADTLSPAQQSYAATDAWACLQIHEEVTRLKRDKNYILELSSPTNNEV